MTAPTDPLILLLSSIAKDLARLADATEALADASAPEAPNYTRPISEYSNFDWATIAAQVSDRDEFGPTHLDWSGYTFTRRSPSNKFGEAIWYSRPIGKDPEGNVKYARLITFKKPSEAEPLPTKVATAVTPKPAPVAASAPVASTPKPAPVASMSAPSSPVAAPLPPRAPRAPAPVAPSPAASAGEGRGGVRPGPQPKIQTAQWKQTLAAVAQALPKYASPLGQPDAYHILNALQREGWTVINDTNINDVLPTLRRRAQDDIRQDAEAKYAEAIPF